MAAVTALRTLFCAIACAALAACATPAQVVTTRDVYVDKPVPCVVKAGPPPVATSDVIDRKAQRAEWLRARLADYEPLRAYVQELLAAQKGCLITEGTP